MFLESELLRRDESARSDHGSGTKTASVGANPVSKSIRMNPLGNLIRRIEKRSAEESKKKTSQPKKGVGKSTK